MRDRGLEGNLNASTQIEAARAGAPPQRPKVKSNQRCLWEGYLGPKEGPRP